MSAFSSGVSFEVVHCCNCGVAFALTTAYQKRRIDDRAWFYCPSGHPQQYTGATEAEKLKRELESKERELASATHRAAVAETQRSEIAKAHKKMRARVVNGVCPCCNRTFQNLRDHMKTQHPDFGNESTMLALRSAFGMTQQAVADEANVTAAYVSLFERGKPVAPYVKQRLERWLETHHAAA